MGIWVVFSLMTFIAVLAILWPLSRPQQMTSPTDSADVSFYREQLSEIERDLGRGLLSAQEAEAAKAEAGRRLLRSTNRELEEGTLHPYKGSLSRRRFVAVLALVLVPAFGFGLYRFNGAPDYQEVLAQQIAIRQQQLTARKQQEEQILVAIDKMEAHLKGHPEDGKAWEVIAPVYLQVGRVSDSVKAYENALRILGENSQRLTGYGRALFFGARGMVFDNAREAFEKAAALDPKADVARFYLGYAAEQNGDLETARKYYAATLAISPDWTEVREHLNELDAQPKGDSGQMTPQAISAMIDSLATRLDQNGGNAKEWAQLARSYIVTGQREKALATLSKARKNLAGDTSELSMFEDAIRPLKIENGEGK